MSAFCSANIKLQIGPRAQGLIGIHNLLPLISLTKLVEHVLINIRADWPKIFPLHFPTQITSMKRMTKNKENLVALISSNKFLSATSSRQN